MCMCRKNSKGKKKMFAFFLLLQLSTYPFYKESRPTKRDMDAPVGFRLSWRSFEHDSLTSGHTRSAPHITFCKTEFEDRTSMGSRKILPVNPSEFVVTSNWHQPWLSRAEKINYCSDIGLKGGQNDSSERTEIKLLLGSTEQDHRVASDRDGQNHESGLLSALPSPCSGIQLLEKYVINLGIWGTHRPHSYRRAQ